MTDLPTGWGLSTIGEVSEIIRGVTYSKADTLSASDKDAIPLLRATNLEVDLITFEDMVYVPKHVVKTHQILRLDDIFLAASSGSISVVGKSARVIETSGKTFGAFCAVIRPRNIHPKFLAYWVQSPEIRDHWSATAKGTNINNLKPSDIAETRIPIPPPPEQHKIVELLEDHLLRLNAALADVKQAKVKAAQFRRSLLQAAFTGNLGSDGTRRLTDFPDDWKILNLGKIVSIRTGKIDANKAVEDGQYPFFTCAREISRINEAPYEGKVILVAGNGDLNVKYYEGKFNAYQRTYFLSSLDENLYHPKYLYYFLESYVPTLRTQSIGTTIKYIKMENLTEAEVPLPPVAEQYKIVAILEDHLSRLDASVALADAMEKQSVGLRRSLLQAAFTGQLTKEVASV